MCQPRVQGTVGAEPFSAKIRYTGPDDPDFPNLIKLIVNMPHMDGEHFQYVALFVIAALLTRLNRHLSGFHFQQACYQSSPQDLCQTLSSP